MILLGGFKFTYSPSRSNVRNVAASFASAIENSRSAWSRAPPLFLQRALMLAMPSASSQVAMSFLVIQARVTCFPKNWMWYFRERLLCLDVTLQKKPDTGSYVNIPGLARRAAKP